jgi:hypothetical protein
MSLQERMKKKWHKVMLPEKCYFCHFFYKLAVSYSLKADILPEGQHLHNRMQAKRGLR